MTDLVEFLRARLDEDEKLVRLADACRWRFRLFDGMWQVVDPDDGDAIVVESDDNDIYPEHIARHDPARVLAEVESKRRIIDEHAWSGYGGGDDHWEPDCPADGHPIPCTTLKLLAQPYADHPDFREEWKLT